MNKRGTSRRGAWPAIAGAVVLLVGCGTPTSLESAESASRIRAIRGAAVEGNRSTIPKLISLLDSDDPAVRFFAIGTLEQMTGERRGYDACGAESERAAAMERWEAWYRTQGTENMAQRGG